MPAPLHRPSLSCPRLKGRSADKNDVTETSVHIDYCAVDAVIEGVTVRMYTQTSSDGKNWTEEGPYEGVGENKINRPYSQYIRYKAEFRTDNANVTPVLRDVRISYTQPPA